MPRHLKRGMDASAIKAADAKVRETVEQILADIEARKDVAVRELSQKFDNWSPASFKLTAAEIERAIGRAKTRPRRSQIRAGAGAQFRAEAERNTARPRSRDAAGRRARPPAYSGQFDQFGEIHRPRTEAGKRPSRLNSYKHGLTGHLDVMTEDERQARDAFMAGIIDRLKPADAIERQLAHSIADGYWRINRVSTIETNLFAAEASDDLAFLNLLTVYEMRLHRKVKSDLQQLREIQSTRRADEAKKAGAGTSRQPQGLRRILRAAGAESPPRRPARSRRQVHPPEWLRFFDSQTTPRHGGQPPHAARQTVRCHQSFHCRRTRKHAPRRPAHPMTNGLIRVHSCSFVAHRVFAFVCALVGPAFQPAAGLLPARDILVDCCIFLTARLPRSPQTWRAVSPKPSRSAMSSSRIFWRRIFVNA